MRNGLNTADLDRYLTTEPIERLTPEETRVIESGMPYGASAAKLDSHSHLILIAHSLRVLANELEMEGTVRGRAERGKARVFALRDYALELEGIR